MSFTAWRTIDGRWLTYTTVHTRTGYDINISFIDNINFAAINVPYEVVEEARKHVLIYPEEVEMNRKITVNI